MEEANTNKDKTPFGIDYLTEENCTFTEKNGFLGISAVVSVAEGDENPDTEGLEQGKKRVKSDRVFLARAFPFDMPEQYISVLDSDRNEIGLILSLEDFGEETKEMLRRELNMRYYTPKIKKILSLKERFGFSYWKTECEFGEKDFTLQDTYKSIVKAPSEDGKIRLFILDVDGNRYEIPDVEGLDRQSYRKLEIYL